MKLAVQVAPVLHDIFFPGNEKRTVEKSTILFILVGVQGFEPWTPWSQTRCATGLRHTPKTNIIAGRGGDVNRFVRRLIEYGAVINV